MVNYKIIADKEALLDFIDWLPDCEETEQYYWCLFSRKKYAPEAPWIKSDKSQLKRGTSRKENLFHKIWQLEVPVGAFSYQDGSPAIQESLAVYISPNPRDLFKSNIKIIKRLLDVIECSGRGSNPHQEAMSQIQRSCGKKRTILFDIDEKNDNVLEDVISIVSGFCDVIETRGGFHVHVDLSKVKEIEQNEKKWHSKLAAISDVSGDEMTPIVGCYQGGFVPKFIYRTKK